MKLAAITALALVGLAVGQTIRPIPTTQVRLVGEVPAEWWTYVELTPSQSFTVPTGHHFVVTGYQGAIVFVDGQYGGLRLAATQIGVASNSRVPFAPGTILTTDLSGTAQLWGYLEPVR